MTINQRHFDTRDDVLGIRRRIFLLGSATHIVNGSTSIDGPVGQNAHVANPGATGGPVLSDRDPGSYQSPLL